MAREAKISLIGMTQWNNDLFSEMSWPTPFTGSNPIMDQDSFLDELLSRTGELELLYTDPNILQHLIGSWSRTRLAVWNHLWDTTQYTYNPIENYDRIEDGTDTDTHSGTDTNNNTTTRSGTDTDTHSGTDSHSNTLARTGSESDTHSGTDTMGNTHTKAGTDTNTTTNKQEQWKAAYDSAAAGDDDGLVKVERNEGTGEQSTVYGTRETDSGSTTHGHVITHGFNSGETNNGSEVYGSQIAHGYNSGETNNGSTVFGHKITTKHDLHVHGNIGTVTAQKMITEEREIAMFNLYDMMIQDFKDRFLILVY